MRMDKLMLESDVAGSLTLLQQAAATDCKLPEGRLARLKDFFQSCGDENLRQSFTVSGWLSFFVR